VSLEGWNGPVHPAADLFPMLPDAELAELADDIAKRGLNHAIVLTKDGVLLDGRNRMVACTRAGVQPHFTEYQGDDPTAYVVSINLRRRHLSLEDRAFLAVELIKVYEDEARQRMLAGKRQDPSPHTDEGKRDPLAAQSAAKAARDVSVSRTTVTAAKRITEQAPDLIPLVRERKMSMSKAETIVRNRAAGIADSDGDSWFTPTWLFDQLGLTFDVDVCAPRKADQRTAPAAHYFTEDDDGLATDWFGLVWCNPPYSKPEAWTDKMIAHGNGMLLTHMPNNAGWAVRAQRAADAARLIQSMHFVRPNGATQRPGYSLMLLAYGSDAAAALEAVDGEMVGPLWVPA
jgi:phage N-6-adenine-methyltransferase